MLRRTAEKAFRRWGPRFVSIGLVAIMALLLGLTSAWPPVRLRQFEDWCLDHVYASLLGGDSRVDDVLVVGLDRRTFQEAGVPWARFVPRLTDVVERLTRAGARLIAFDVSLSTCDGESARRLEEAIAAGPPFVLAYSLPRDEETKPPRPPAEGERAVFASPNVHSAFIDIVAPEGDGTRLRRVALTATRRERRHYSFALTIWSLVVGANLDEARLSHDGVTAGAKTLPLEDGHFRVPYLARGGGIPKVSCADLLASRLPDTLYRDRVVILGPAADWFHDEHPTPVGNLLGASIHATIVDALLSGRSLARPGRPFSVALVFLSALVGLGASFWLRRPWSIVGVLAAAVAIVALSGHLCLSGVWLPFVSPIAALGVGFACPPLMYLAHEALEGLLVKRLFGQFVSREVFRAIMRDRDTLALSGKEVRTTVLFSDIRGFTTLSARLGPEETFTVLNEYLKEMVAVIFRNGGRLDKFMGDGIMAVYGAPFPASDDALQAARTAVAMQERLKALNRRFATEGRAEIAVGVGLCTGPVQAGVIGTREKMEYAIIGDTVNTASRLEHLTKEAGTPILMDEETYRATAEYVEAQSLGKRDIRGRDDPISVYALHGLKEGA